LLYKKMPKLEPEMMMPVDRLFTVPPFAISIALPPVMLPQFST